MDIQIGLFTKIIGLTLKAKDWIMNIFWLFKNVKKVKENINKVGADKPCPACKNQMSFTRTQQDKQVTFHMSQKVPVPGKYWIFFKCSNKSCTFKDEVPFRYETWNYQKPDHVLTPI